MTPILRLRDVVVRYGDVVAVDAVDLEVEEKALTALLGPSGCGKTSLLRAIAGFEVPVAGRIEIGGRCVAGDDHWVPPERRHVGMVFQQGALFPHLSVWHNVLYGVKRRPDGSRLARQALERVGMEEFGARYPDELSGGQQQRVALARALAPSPKMVLLDEPFANLDAALRQRVRQEVRQILVEAETTAVLVTHDQEEALSVADRVAVMSRGKILQAGTSEEIYHRPRNVEVARFVGEGQLVDCTVAQGLARSVFGTAPSDAPEGPGLLLVRPEDLQVFPDAGAPATGNGNGHGLRGQVVGRQFFGHDLLDEVRLDSGDTIQVRHLSTRCPDVGAWVRLGLRDQECQVFPRD